MMLRELDQIADRINQLAALAQSLREENQVLRLQLSEAEASTRSLRSRLDAARQRIEALIEKLPAE
jgi:cell division septum initiation protein DivIVA